MILFLFRVFQVKRLLNLTNSIDSYFKLLIKSQWIFERADNTYWSCLCFRILTLQLSIQEIITLDRAPCKIFYSCMLEDDFLSNDRLMGKPWENEGSSYWSDSLRKRKLSITISSRFFREFFLSIEPCRARSASHWDTDHGLPRRKNDSFDRRKQTKFWHRKKWEK